MPLHCHRPNIYRFVTLCLVILLTALTESSGQEQSNSPIYKNYRPPSPSSQLKRSDIDYNLMHIFMLERKAYAGDIAAQHELGLRYLLGEGTDADTLKGAFWIRRAADQNSADAQYNLGIMEFNGWGMPWNPFEAYKLFKAAAANGMAEAQYIFSMFLTENLVVQRNWEESYRWLKKAADANYAPAKEALADFEARGLGLSQPTTAKSDTASTSKKPAIKQTLGFVFQDAKPDTAVQSDETLLKDALREATPQLKRALGISKESTRTLSLDAEGMKAIREAAEEGSPEALTILARSYERGIGIQKNIILAALNYIRALRMSSPRAPGLLSRLMEEGQLFSLLKSRVNQGDANAQVVWAALAGLKIDYLLTQREGMITDKQALEFLHKAASAQHIQALIELGLCYYSGRWVPEDRQQALSFWERASALGNREAKIRIAAISVRSERDSAQLHTSIALLEEAAQKGSILAQVALGFCYETGTGVKLKTSEAVRLFRSSAQRGSQDAYYALKRMHDRIRPSEKEFEISDFE